MSAALALMAGTPAEARSAARPPTSEIVLDAGTGRVLYDAGADRVRPPASLAKMMTLLLTHEAIRDGRLSSAGPLVMTRLGARQRPSRLGMKVGDRIRLGDAMRIVAVISANDVAVAMAERVAGSEPRFVAAMNRRAAQLGMASTRFDNATGLSPSASVTSARDMALLGRHIIGIPELYRLFSTCSITWHGRRRRNHNRLLGRLAGVDGLKTGYTVNAGFNLVASGRRGKRRIIAVVLGARTASARDLLVSNLLEEGFSSSSMRGSASPVHLRMPQCPSRRSIAGPKIPRRCDAGGAGPEPPAFRCPPDDDRCWPSPPE